MGSVYLKRGIWYGKYKDALGREKRHPLKLKVPTKTAAKALLAELEHAIGRQRRGLEAIPVDCRLTLAELCEWWLKERCPAASAGIERQRLTRHIIGPAGQPLQLGAVPLPMVDAAMLEQHLHQLERREEEPLAPASINKLRAMLHSAFEQARKAKLYTGANPVAEVEARKVPKRIYATLRDEEVPLALAHVPKDWRGVCATAVYTGLRKGELLGLRKADVALPHRLLAVRWSYDNDTTKGGDPALLPIAPPLVPYLEAALRSPGAYLFPWPDGRPRGRETDPHLVLRRALGRAGIVEGYLHICRRCKAAGRPEGEPHLRQDAVPTDCGRCQMRLWVKPIPRKVRLHDLRHTTGTELLRAGVDVHRVQRLLRHADVRTTTTTYAHLVVEDLREAVGRLPAARPAGAPADSVTGWAPEVPAPPKASGPDPAKVPSSGPDYWWEQQVSNLRPLPCEGGEILPEQWEPSRAAVISSGCVALPIPIVPIVPAGGEDLVTRWAPDQLLTVREVAAALGVSTATVYRLAKAGELPHVRLGSQVRVVPAALRAFLVGHRGH